MRNSHTHQNPKWTRNFSSKAGFPNIKRQGGQGRVVAISPDGKISLLRSDGRVTVYASKDIAVKKGRTAEGFCVGDTVITGAFKNYEATVAGIYQGGEVAISYLLGGTRDTAGSLLRLQRMTSLRPYENAEVNARNHPCIFWRE